MPKFETAVSIILRGDELPSEKALAQLPQQIYDALEKLCAEETAAPGRPRTIHVEAYRKAQPAQSLEGAIVSELQRQRQLKKGLQ